MRRFLLLPFAIAALFIASLETVIGLVGNSGRYSTDFFDFSPLNQDVLQKHVVYDKFVRILGETQANAVQVGDSSGFYSVRPADVARAAPDISYLNLSCCADTGWTGHFYLARLALAHAPTPKFLVLHVTPFWPVATDFAGQNSFATLIRDYLLKEHWWHRLRLPSSFYRLRLLNLLYKGVWLDDFTYDRHERPADIYPALGTWRAMFEQNRGWVPMPVDYNDVLIKRDSPAVCAFKNGFSESRFLGLGRIDTLYDYLAQFAELARAHGGRFVLVTNPVPCIVQQDAVYADIERQIARFKADYPDALVPFAFLRQRPLAEFVDRWHLNEAGLVRHSREIGEALEATRNGRATGK